MLRPQPRPKVRKLTPVPDTLREALREAYAIIEESKHDPDVHVSFGDAIQMPNMIGGRVGSKKRPYEFTYLNGEEPLKGRWRLAFHLLEIEDIIEGHTAEIAIYCCASPEFDHKSNDRAALCDCDYIRDPLYGNFEFPAAEMPLKLLGISGISATSTRDEVEATLGKPSRVGGGCEGGILGYVHPWIKYERGDCQLRFEFLEGKGIRLVSVMEANWKPGM